MKNEPELPTFIQKLNPLGRFVIFTHLLACFGITYYFVNAFMLNAPSGSYPLYFVFGPPFGGTILLYLLVMFILRKIGIKVDKEEKQDV